MHNCDCILRHFKPVTFDDISIIKKYLALHHYEESNHNVVNIMEWLELYPLYEYHEDDYMILIGTYKDEYFMYMPLCQKGKELEVINIGKHLMDACDIPFTMSCFEEEIMRIVKDKYPDARIIDVRDGYDYVYELDKLRSFSGKKLQKKRNHLNNFMKTYEGRYHYETINQSNLDEVIAYVETLAIDDETLAYEKSGIIKVLKHLDILEARGGLIKIDGKIEAFLIASILSETMVQENIEKSNHEINGLAQMLIKEFFSHEYQEYIYLNREDDMGKENLRQSKLSYQPCHLISKYYISFYD